MNHFAATITSTEIVLAERTHSGMIAWTIAIEDRPENLAAADAMLAVYGYGRTGAWDLDGQNLVAPVATVDNLFNGTRAARLDLAVGTTHEKFELAMASTVGNGDLVTDREFSEVYVVGGSSTECGSTKLHMVREGATWGDRHTGEFEGLIMVARRKA